MLMGYFAMEKMFIHSMDVSTAFLNPELKEDIYLEVPDGINVSNKTENTVLLRSERK